MQNDLNILGISSSFGGNLKGSEKAPEALKKSLLGNHIWHDFIHEHHFQNDHPFEKILELSCAIASKAHQLVSQGEKTLFIGGDHSVAIGTWKGVMQAMVGQGDIGLLWVDAHMDSHTPQTSETGNIHGMPLATLLGHGNEKLISMNSSIKLKPENVCLIGIRSYESGEYELLKELGVKIYFIEEVLRKGFSKVLNDAVTHVSKHTVGFGLSFDVDSLDPYCAPGVSTPVQGGISLEECIKGFQLLKNNPDLITTEIVEYNPEYDDNFRTISAIDKTLKTIYPEFFS